MRPSPTTTQYPGNVLRVATYNIHKGVRGVGPKKRLEIHNLVLGIGAPEAPLVALVDWQLVNAYDIYPQWQHRYAPGVTRNTEHVFGLCVDREVAVRVAPREHLRFEWLDWRAAADRCASPSNAQAILQLPERPRDTVAR